jgi:hypothetical protein
VEKPRAGGTPAPLVGGQLLAAISTSVVATLREHYSRGPMKAKTYALDAGLGERSLVLQYTAILDSCSVGRIGVAH